MCRQDWSSTMFKVKTREKEVDCHAAQPVRSADRLSVAVAIGSEAVRIMLMV